MATLANAITHGKASARLERAGRGRYKVMVWDKLWLSTNYQMARGLVLRMRVAVTLKWYMPNLTERKISDATEHAYYNRGCRSFRRALEAAIARIEQDRARYL